MATGACGIDCSVCRLHVEGLCSTCGAGTSKAGQAKLTAQKRLFGQGCPILACAVDRALAFCPRDCEAFPCERFQSEELGGHYPYSEAYLAMQLRRRTEISAETSAAWPPAAEEYWTWLVARDPVRVSDATGVMLAPRSDPTDPASPPIYAVQSLREAWQVDATAKTVRKVQGAFGGEWDRQIPFVLLTYLALAKTDGPDAPEGASDGARMVSPREIYAGIDAFAGVNALQTQDLAAALSVDADRFLALAARLGGEPVDGADATARFSLLPRVHVDVQLWLADDEFPAEVKILLGADTATHLPADVTALAVNLLLGRLLLEHEAL